MEFSSDFMERYRTACQLRQPVNETRITGLLGNIIRQNPDCTTARVDIVRRVTHIANLGNNLTPFVHIPFRIRNGSFQATIHSPSASEGMGLWIESPTSPAFNALWNFKPGLTDIGIAVIHSSISARWGKFEWRGDQMLEVFEAGAWQLLLTEDRMMVVPVPSVIETDANNRLHSENGPALFFLNWPGYYWHGTLVPAWIIQKPETITAGYIDAVMNIEVRRALIDIYGAERYLKDTRAELIDSSMFRHRIYDLYRREIERDEAIQMIRVTNATPEPDGSFKDYWLRVPPTIDNAIDAVAWTFNLTRLQYQALIFES